jgi:hypothetical protein
MSQWFRTHHVDSNLSVHGAMSFHERRPDSTNSTLTNMTAQDAADEIRYYLKNLNAQESNDLVNWSQISFTTHSGYQLCHTQIDSVGTVSLAKAGYGTLNLTMAWQDPGGYYQIMHLDSYNA